MDPSIRAELLSVFLALTFSISTGAQPNASPLDALDPSEIPEELRLAKQPAEIVAIVRGHSRAVASLAFSPDGKSLVSSGWDNRLIWWKFDGKKMTEAKSGDGSPSGVAYCTARKKLLATGTTDTRLLLRDGDKKPIALAGHRNRPFAVAFSPNDRLLASGSGDPTLRVWKLEDDEPEAWGVLANETTTALGVSSLSFSHDNKYLAMGHHAGKGTLRIWDASGNIMEEVDIPVVAARLVCFSPTAAILAFSGDDSIHLWEMKDGKPASKSRVLAHPQKDPPGAVKALAFSPDGKRLASCGNDGRLVLWDALKFEKLREWTLEGEGRAVAIAPDARHVAVGSAGGCIYILRLAPIRMRQ